MCVSIYMCIVHCMFHVHGGRDRGEFHRVRRRGKNMMEEWSEVNSCGGNDRSNYPGYKLYAVSHEFSCLCVVFGCWKYMMCMGKQMISTYVIVYHHVW